MAHQKITHLIQAAEASLCIRGCYEHPTIPNRLHYDALHVHWQILLELHSACMHKLFCHTAIKWLRESSQSSNVHRISALPPIRNLLDS